MIQAGHQGGSTGVRTFFAESADRVLHGGALGDHMGVVFICSNIELVGQCKIYECKEESRSCFLLVFRLIGSRAHFLLEILVGLLGKGLEHMVLYSLDRLRLRLVSQFFQCYEHLLHPTSKLIDCFAGRHSKVMELIEVT